jgi:hypothetical protein
MIAPAVQRRLRLDAAALEVIDALDAAGIEVVLLKGPITAAWLYADEQRTYVDIDLLVAPDRFDEALTTVRSLGFRSSRSEAVGGEIELRRLADDTTIDLHASLKEVGVAPAVAWRLWRSHAEHFDLHGRSVLCLDLASRLVHACTHALQTGATKTKARDDLRRAIDVADVTDWRAAAVRARQLDASDAVELGLRLYGSDAGVSLADDLGLDAGVGSMERLRSYDRSGVVAMARKLARSDPKGRRLLLRGWLRPERSRIESRLGRHDVPDWLRRLPPNQATLLLLLPVLVSRAAWSLARGALSGRRC